MSKITPKKTFFCYDDKSHNVFYNASGYANAKNKELSDVLRFIYNLGATSDFTKKLETSVHIAKSQGMMRDEYMYFQDILEEEKEISLEIGREEATITVAKKMFLRGFDMQSIVEITGLSLEKVEEIKRSMSL